MVFVAKMVSKESYLACKKGWNRLAATPPLILNLIFLLLFRLFSLKLLDEFILYIAGH